jgi:hypothetical protein
MEKSCEYCSAIFYTNVSIKKYCRRSCKLSAEALKEQTSDVRLFGLSTHLLINDDLKDTLKTVHRSECFLNFCLSLFWIAREFKEEEKIEFLNLISKQFKGSLDIDDTYYELVQCAILYKREFSTKAYSFVPEPIDWFDSNYLYGLSKTKLLYSEVKQQREQIPSFKSGLIVVAEGVLSYYNKRNILDISFYKNKLIATGDSDLLQTYLNAVMQIQFLSH